MARINVVEVSGGLFVTAIGAAFALGSLAYPFGQAVNPGPAIFPLVVAIVTVALGMSIAIKGLMEAAESVRFDHRSVLAVIAAIAAFGLLIRPFGLIPTLVVVVLVASLGSREARPLTAAAVAIGTALGSWIVFVLGLGLPIPAIRLPI